VRFQGHLGRVQGIGWRSTRVMTRAQERLEIPNSLLAKDVLTNYSHAQAVGDEIFVGLTYSEPPNRVKEVALQTLVGIPEVLIEPAPQVDAWEYGDSAIKYRIRFWIADYAIQERVRDRIVSSLWYGLRRNSIEIPFPTRTVFMHQMRSHSEVEAEHQQRLRRELRAVDFLRDLSDEELEVLIPMIKVHQYGHSEILMREGDPGECFHIMRRGTVELTARGQNGASVHIATLTAPAFFGETSLMTGELRNATIRAETDVEVLELSRQGFAQLFQARPEAAAQISQVITQRLNERRERTAAHASQVAVGRSHSWFLDKMRAIFDFE
jgi:CRP-like cAMP-binding protein